MKKIKKTILTSAIVVFASLGLSTNLACDTSCDEIAQYSDLLTTLLNITSGFIEVGNDVIIANEITNEGISNVCDILSETAGESKYSLDFDYRVNSSSDWITSAATALIQIEELVANSSTVENFQFVFNQSGEYRISGLADAQNDVLERDEDNNGREFVQSRSANNNSNGGLFVVVNKSNSRTKVNIDEPIIKIEAGKNKNLISFKSISIKEELN